MSEQQANYERLPGELRGEARSALARVRAGAAAMPRLALSGALLLVAGAATWAGGAVAAKGATRAVFTWAGVEHAFIDSLELGVVAGAAVLLPWVVGLVAYAAWWKGGGAAPGAAAAAQGGEGGEAGGGNSGSSNGNGNGGGLDSGTLLLAALQALAVSTLLFAATVTWTADMDAARDRLGGGPWHHRHDPAGGGGGDRPWGPPPPAAPANGGGGIAAAPICPEQCLDISAVVKVFKLPLPPCFCGQQWLLRDLYVHMDDAMRGLAAATAGASAAWVGAVALVLWAAEERVLAAGGIF